MHEILEREREKEMERERVMDTLHDSLYMKSNMYMKYIIDFIQHMTVYACNTTERERNFQCGALCVAVVTCVLQCVLQRVLQCVLQCVLQ